MNQRTIIFGILALGTPLVIVLHLFVDLDTARWVIVHRESLSGPFNFLSYFADSTGWLIASALGWLYWSYNKRDRFKAKASGFFFIAIVASGLAVNVLKMIFGKARPTELLKEEFFGFTWFAKSYSYFSFPSGHTTTAFTIATVLALLFPRYWAWFYMYAVVMAASRVLSLWHYPSDVLAGAMLGTIATLLLYNVNKISFKAYNNAP